MGNVRPPINRNGAQNPLLPNSGLMQERKETNKLCRLCSISVTIILSILLIIFIVLFVVLPLYFKNSVEFQRSFVFQTDEWPSEPEYTNYSKYSLDGVQNFYVNVNKRDNISLGVWHILPENVVYNHSDGPFNFSALLIESDYPVLLYFHGNAGNRIGGTQMYLVLRKFFHIIAFDYRGYADSTDATPTEEAIVEDSVQLYKWLRTQTNLDIYFWGHSLGSALSVHTIANLRDEDIVPMGLFLEAPFTSLADVVRAMPLAQVFSWLPWFEATIVAPLRENGFVFNSSENILKVNCPIMIMHAVDDESIPLVLGEKLYKVAQDDRDLYEQGNVTFTLIPASFHCGHMEGFKYPELPKHISDHISICEAYNTGRG